jgi:Protein of unknown function (DUF3999)
MIPVLLFAAVLSRTITPAQAGPNRLDPDTDLLAHARTDLGDLRITDASGREVPYLVIAPPSRAPQWLAGRVLPVAATKMTSGFELDLGAAHDADRIRLDGIAAPFLKRARLEGSGDRAHWTLLASDATVFDLPDEKLRNVEIAFAAGSYRYLRVTWDDRASAVVRSIGSASARLHDAGAPADAVRVPLAFHKISSEPQKSRYRITLPGPHLPIAAIEPVVANGEVFRSAAVYAQRLEESQIMPVLLGSATLKRAQRFGGVATDMAIPVERPNDVDLELVVDDANNPPLVITAIEAKLAPLPWIWLESANGAPLTARYGDERLTAPSYDIEASRTSIARSNPPHARFDVSQPAPSVTETTTIASFRGATLNRNDFRYARPIPAAPPGVTRLALDADVLARSRAVADVRLVDASDRQVPYIVENCAAPLVVPLRLGTRQADGTSSRYALDLPYDHLPATTTLIVTTSAHVFEREVTLQREREPDRAQTAVWRSTQPDIEPPPLQFNVSGMRSRRVELVVREGDNAPLPITGARLELPGVALRFYNSGSPLTLLYGSDRAAPPEYDLAILAPRVLGEPARDLSLAGAVPPAGDRSFETTIFWIALAVVTIALLAVLARLIR